MFKREIRRFIVLNEENNPIAVDYSTGGYPYDSPAIEQTTFFILKHEAEKYAAMFKGYKAIPVTLTVEEIK